MGDSQVQRGMVVFIATLLKYLDSLLVNTLLSVIGLASIVHYRSQSVYIDFSRMAVMKVPPTMTPAINRSND